MEFVPASITAGAERNVFINHDGAYWLNPVPHGKLTGMQSYRVALGSADNIDPFGRLKPRDGPNLFGVSRYRGRAREGEGEESTARQHIGTDQNSFGDNEGGESGKGGEYVDKEGGEHRESPARVGEEGDGANNFASSGKQAFVYSARDIVDDKFPLETAYPECRVVHPGNHEERICPTGGSEYNGVVTEPWKEPRAADNTYLRLAPLYESTTHHQLRTGLYYTEDEAPPHGMKLPPKNSLAKREW